MELLLRRALVVEDTAVHQHLIREILEAKGFAVTVVATAEEAKLQVQTTYFQLMTIDVQLSGADRNEDGLALARWMGDLPWGPYCRRLILTAVPYIQDVLRRVSAYDVRALAATSLG